jgi:hypothetical protein
MVDAIRLFVGAILRLLRTRRRLLLENLALRQQLAVLKRKHARPRLAALDKLFWVLVRRFWSEWKQALLLVGPETVVRWHRSGFAMYWRAISRSRRIVGRRRASKEVRDLIFRMVAENSMRASIAAGPLHDFYEALLAKGRCLPNHGRRLLRRFRLAAKTRICWNTIARITRSQNS